MRLLPALLAFSLGLPAAAAQFQNQRPLTSARASVEQHDPALSFTSRGPLAVFLDPALESALVTAAPAGAHILNPDAATAVAVSSIGEASLVAAVQGTKLSSWRIGRSGERSGEIVPLAEVEPGARVSVGTNGTEYLVAWSGPSGMILGAIVGADGKVVAPAQTLVKASSRTVKRVAIASDGRDFFVVWDAVSGSEWQTMAVLVSPEGPPRWMLPMPISMNGAAPDIVWNGSEYLVVWHNVPDGGIRGRRISPEGVLRSSILVVTVKGDLAPRLAWDGTGYSMAFARETDARQSPVVVLAALRLTREGLPAEMLTGGALAAGIEPGQYAIAARGGEVALVYRKDKGLMISRARVGLPQPLPARRAPH